MSHDPWFDLNDPQIRPQIERAAADLERMMPSERARLEASFLGVTFGPPVVIPGIRQIGIFRAGGSRNRNDERWARDMLCVLAGCVVVKAECLWSHDAIEYTALHADFDVIREGCEPRRYEAELTQQANNVVTRKWVRLPGS
jgi:hypothetical protein